MDFTRKIVRNDFEQSTQSRFVTATRVTKPCPAQMKGGSVQRSMSHSMDPCLLLHITRLLNPTANYTGSMISVLTINSWVKARILIPQLLGTASVIFSPANKGKEKMSMHALTRAFTN